MAIPKLMGIENEFGMFVPEDNRKKALVTRQSSSLLSDFWLAMQIVDAASGIATIFKRPELKPSFLNDFPRQEIEKALEGVSDDAQGLHRELLRALGASGNMLSNGARFYVDLGHPEYSTPECLTAKDLICWDKAGQKIVDSCRVIIQQATGIEIEIHKDNSDRHGTDFGTHENYLVLPETFEEIITPAESGKGIQLINFLVARPILCGAGKAGSENSNYQADFQISQRADFIMKSWHYDTGIRSIINCRDRSYANSTKFRRLHVILGDANMCEYAFFLKMGLTGIFLKMLEDDFIGKSGSFLCQPLEDPVLSLKVVSQDLTFREPLPFCDGKKITGLNIIEEVLRLSHLYFEQCSVTAEEEEILEVADFFLEKLKSDFTQLYGYSDWVTKYRILMRDREKTGQSWNSEHLKRLDGRYHNLNPEIGYYLRLEKAGVIKRLVSEEAVLRAVKEPPENTRAYLRGKCIEKFGHLIGNISWNFIRFDSEDGKGSYRLDLPNPLLTKAESLEILDNFPAAFTENQSKQKKDSDTYWGWLQ